MNKIGIFSAPRSGSTWLGQIFNSSPNVVYRFQPNFAYSFKPVLSDTSSLEDINFFFQELIETEDDFVNARISISSKKSEMAFKKDELNTLVFKETHYIHIIKNLIQKSDIKIVGLVRSPFSVINSWRKIPKEFAPSWNLKDEWIDAPSKNQNKDFNYFGFAKWKEITLLFLELKQRFPDRVYIVNYDDLLDDTNKTIQELFDFCNLEFSHQTKTFLESSRKKEDKDAYSFFRQKKDDNQWKNDLPEYIIKGIKEDNEFIELNNSFNWV